MPRVVSRLVPDAETGARMGARIRKLRAARGLGLRDLAAKAGVSRNTLLRLEQGHPVSDRLLTRVCNSLDTIPPNLLVSDEEWDRPYRVHRADRGDWRLAFNRPSSPFQLPDFEPVPDAVERQRLGRLGFVTGFVHGHRCALRDGQLHASTVELYGRQERPPYHHAGEEFVLCLSGRVRVTVDRQEVTLNEGDSMTFWSHHPHKYEATEPPAAGAPPPRILMVWIEGPEPPAGTL